MITITSAVDTIDDRPASSPDPRPIAAVMAEVLARHGLRASTRLAQGDCRRQTPRLDRLFREPAVA